MVVVKVELQITVYQDANYGLSRWLSMKFDYSTIPYENFLVKLNFQNPPTKKGVIRMNRTFCVIYNYFSNNRVQNEIAPWMIFRR